MEKLGEAAACAVKRMILDNRMIQVRTRARLPTNKGRFLFYSITNYSSFACTYDHLCFSARWFKLSSNAPTNADMPKLPSPALDCASAFYLSTAP